MKMRRRVFGLLQIIKWTRAIFCSRSSGSSEDRTEMIRLVLPESLQQDFLHHYQTSLEEATKRSEERTSGFASIYIGEGNIGASNSMWAIV